MEIKNVRVYGLEESIIASGYPMALEVPNEEEFSYLVEALNYAINSELNILDDEEMREDVERNINRIMRLSNTPLGSGHSNALKGIIVQYDLKAPEYFWRQFDRYHFHDYVSSQSKMHKILKFDIDKMCNKYVSQEAINNLTKFIDMYNNYKEGKIEHISLRDGSKIPYTKANIFQMIVSNCPMGFELTARITDNYLQLKTIYHQRKNHPLEEWKYYLSWIESLPMAKELIVGSDQNGC